MRYSWCRLNAIPTLTIYEFAYLASSSDEGATWRQRHAGGPFDLRTAPRGQLGEYQGMTGLRRGFGTVVTMARPAAENGPSDVFYGRLRP